MSQDKHDQLINELTTLLVGRPITTMASTDEPLDGLEKQAAMVKTAGDMLRFAAARIRELEQDNARQNSEIQRLTVLREFDEHKARAEKLAALMCQKGFCKTADCESRAADLALMDDVSFAALQSAVEKSQGLEKSAANYGIGDLTFLSEHLNMDSEESQGKTMSQSFALALAE